MAIPFTIIDGYNLLHAAGLARLRYAQGDLERARHRLLGMLCEKLSPPEQQRCTVVFDGQNGPPGVSGESTHQGLKVIFAPAGSDADTVIEEMLASHSSPRQIVLVSSDHRLHKAARRRGSTPMDSDPFWDRLRERPDARTELISPADREAAKAKPSARPKSKAASSTDAWLAEFGAISVNEIAAEVRAEEQSVPGGSPWERHLSDLEQVMGDERALRKFLEDDSSGRSHKPGPAPKRPRPGL